MYVYFSPVRTYVGLPTYMYKNVSFFKNAVRNLWYPTTGTASLRQLQNVYQQFLTKFMGNA